MAEDNNIQMMSDVLIDINSPLNRLADMFVTGDEGFAQRTFLDFATEDEPFDVVRKFSLKRIEQACESRFQSYNNAFMDGSPINAGAEAFTFGLFTQAYIFVFPPVNNGVDIYEAVIDSVLEASGIVYGIDRDVIRRIAEEKLYLKMICVARGIEPMTGEDGSITDRFPREVDYAPAEGEKGEVDFKSLNWLIKVNEGDVICDIVPATKGSDGINVRGGIIEGRPGKMPPIPQGKNTKMSEDGTQLLCGISGQLFFSNNTFYIEQVLTINGDVGAATGNLNVIGDVVVTGNIVEGFAVVATGSVTVRGMAESSRIICGGDIFLAQGMKGNDVGYLKANRDIRCKYIENATVIAGNNVYVESVINSNVRCEGTFYATSGRGSVIGGSISTLKGADVKIAGSIKEVKTRISVDLPGSWQKKYNDLQIKINDLNSTVVAEEHNRMLAEQKKGLLKNFQGSKDELMQMIKKMPKTNPELDIEAMKAEIEKHKKTIEELKKTSDESKRSLIEMRTVYPRVTAVIHNIVRDFDIEQTRVKLRFDGDRLAMGSADDID